MQNSSSQSTLAALILAAGKSQRMGSPKALLQWGTCSFLETICHNCLAAGITDIIIVTGYHSSAVRKAHSALPVSWVENPRPDHGMLSSLRCGLNHLPSENCSLLLCLTDYPAVSFRTYLDLVARASDSSIILPVHNGRRGHPVVFGAAFITELRDGPCPEGARSVVRDHPDAIIEMQTDDPAILWDINTPEAYTRYTTN